MVGEFARRVRLLAWSVTALALTPVTLTLFVLAVTGFPLVLVSVGIPLLFAVVVVTRPFADLHRRYCGRVLGYEIGSPYLERVEGNLLVRTRRLVTNPAVWRDLIWTGVNGTAGLVLCVLAVIESILDLLFWWLPPALAIRAHARLCAALLRPTERTSLAQRVEQLAASRAETIDTSAAELRRIERDLHDGAQARLVALGMSLGLAEEELTRDPEAARALIAEARASSSTALAELRDLVRGIHPPVLADRGLEGAVRALCLGAPIPIEVEAALPRLAAPVESAAYFAVAEAVANVIKHSGAARADVRLALGDGTLRLCVRDDGRGGADPALGTGLRGIERRLSAFDGSLGVSSPPGGPTELVMTLRTA